MHTARHATRWLRLSVVLLALCAWLAQPTATPVQAHDHPLPTTLTPGVLAKGEGLERNQELTVSFLGQTNAQMLIAAVNLDHEDDAARRTAPQVTVNCPGVSDANSGAKIPSTGISIVTRGVSSSAVFCTPGGAFEEKSPVTVTATIKNTNKEKINTYAMFFIQLGGMTGTPGATEINLPDSNDNIKNLNFLAGQVAIYKLPEQRGVLTVKFALQYYGSDAEAYAFVYRDTDATTGCSATRWWDKNKSGNNPPSQVGSCSLHNGDSTENDNYLVVLNAKNNCIRYRAYLDATFAPLPLGGNSSCR